MTRLETSSDEYWPKIAFAKIHFVVLHLDLRTLNGRKTPLPVAVAGLRTHSHDFSVILWDISTSSVKQKL